MKYQISNVSILQTSKVVAILYAIFGLLLVPLGCGLILLGNEDPVSLVTGVIYLFGPVLYGVIGFLFTALAIWLYNLIVPRLGGIEFELKEVTAVAPAGSSQSNAST